MLLLASTLLQVTQQQTKNAKIEKRETFIQQPFMQKGYLRPRKVVTQAQYNQCVREGFENGPGGWG